MWRGGDRLKGQLEMSWLAAGTHHHGWPTRATIDSDIPRQVLVARMNAYSQRVDLVTAETNTSTAYCRPTAAYSVQLILHAIRRNLVTISSPFNYFKLRVVRVTALKILGVTITDKLSMSEHVVREVVRQCA